MLLRVMFAFPLIVALAACGADDDGPGEDAQRIETEQLSTIVRELASDDQWIADYIGTCYHQTCDAWNPDWDLRGAAQDIELFRPIIEDLGNSRRWPEWEVGSEFMAAREQSTNVRQ